MKVKALGHGIYTYSEAGRLTGLGGQRVRSWFEGCNAGKPRGGGHVFRSDYGSGGVISFLDLIEVLVAGHMRELGISLIAVRKAYAALRQYLNTQHPFSHRDLLTDGQKLFIYLERESQQHRSELIEIAGQQHAIPEVLMPYLRRVDYDNVSHLARQWNIGDDIVIDPARALGKPIVRASAMPTAVLAAAYHANGQDAERVADWYGVAPDDVLAAVRFEGQFAEAAA